MDYHIYIHNQTEGGDRKPTTPKPAPTPSPTKPKPSISLKALAPVAIAAAALRMADKAYTAYQSFYTTATGDYRGQYQYSNMKAVISALVNPGAAVYGTLMEKHRIAIANRKAEFQRELLGDAMISERTKRI